MSFDENLVGFIFDLVFMARILTTSERYASESFSVW